LHSILLTPDEVGVSDDKTTLEAIQKLIHNTNKSIFIHQDNILINEFGENDNLIMGAYPWLFFLGQGVPKKGSQPQPWFEYILNYGDNRFIHDQTLILSLFNQKQRHAAANTVAPKIKAHPKMIERFNVDKFENDLESAIQNPKSNEAKSLLRNILPTLYITGANVPFGPIERNKSLSELYTSVSQHGLLRFHHQILIHLYF
jgi:hypothetical protein